MNKLCIVFIAAVILGVTSLPGRARRQFDWDQYVNDVENLQPNIRISRQRGPTRWNNGGWNQPMGRQIPANNFNFNQNTNNQGQVNGDTTSTASDATTRSPQSYTNCLARCDYTKQYNPVCGTDAVTYHNAYHLQCAARCGRVVSLARGGTCLPV